MIRPQAFFSWSGGKDSLLALHHAFTLGFDIRTLLVMMDETGERSRSHAISPSLLKAQADALNIPLRMANAGWSDYESVFTACLKDFAKQGIRHGIFGDIDLDPHREWEERVCSSARIQACLPLWKKSRKELTQLFLRLGYKAIAVCVNGDYLDASFAGRAFDQQFLDDLPSTVDACGENGEFHTFVTAGPRFRYPLRVRVNEVYSTTTHSTPYHYANLTL